MHQLIKTNMLIHPIIYEYFNTINTKYFNYFRFLILKNKRHFQYVYTVHINLLLILYFTRFTVSQWTGFYNFLVMTTFNMSLSAKLHNLQQTNYIDDTTNTNSCQHAYYRITYNHGMNRFLLSLPKKLQNLRYIQKVPYSKPNNDNIKPVNIQIVLNV